MSGNSSPAPDTLELAALLCSRVCHDLISPVGAIVNGLEVLDDNPKPEDREFALDLIRKSAKTASARLQFCRLAFGAAGSSDAQIDLGDAENMARGHLEDNKTKITWNLPRVLLPKNKVKLLLNMMVIAQQTIPRGGVLTVDPVGEGNAIGFRVGAAGLNARESAELNQFLHAICHDHSTSMLLIEHDMSVVMEISDHVIVLDHGVKIADGTADEVRSDQRVIAAYLGVEGEEVEQVHVEVGL